MRVHVLRVMVAAVVGFGDTAHAQDEVQDSGSRASRVVKAEAEREAAKEAEADGEADSDGAPRKRGGAPRSKDDKHDEEVAWAELGTDYHLAVFGGHYAQDNRVGMLVDAAFEETLSVGDQQWSAEVAYLHDPFSTKTFNFADDDQDQDTATTRSRVVQALHEFDGELAWRGDWTRYLRTDVKLLADAWWPAYARDQRWSVRALPTLRLGASRGWFGRVSGELFYKKFPNYLVADRRLDSQGGEASVEGGYDLGVASLSGGFEYRHTSYLDARYDRLTSDLTIVRSEQSKDYLRSAPFANLVIEAHKMLRVSVRYKLELNDAQHYDRRMTGRDAGGALVAKLIPSYYDYNRHRASMRVRFRPERKISFELMGEVWLRDFDHYEARDVDNVWTGQRRSDMSVELGFEGSYRLLRFGRKGMRQELHLVAFGSHLDRSSNMKREVSFATNFQVTRAFVGVELRGP